MPEVRHLHDNDNIIVVNPCIRHTANGTVGLGRGPEGGECHVRWNVATGDIRPHTRVYYSYTSCNERVSGDFSPASTTIEHAYVCLVQSYMKNNYVLVFKYIHVRLKVPIKYTFTRANFEFLGPMFKFVIS